MNMVLRPILIFFILLMAAPPVMAAPPGTVFVNSVEGHVEHIPAATQRALKAKPNTPLKEGDTVRVPGAGNAEIFMQDGSILRLSDFSRLKVLSVERDAVQLSLEAGKAYVKYTGLKGHPLFLNSPSAQLDAYDRTTFRADITPSGDTEVSVYSGQLYVAQPKGRMTIIAGTRLVTKKDGGTPVYTTNRPADAWDEWNRKKDGPQQEPAAFGPGPETPPAAYPPPPAAVDRSYIYVAPVPYWGYSYYYYPWGYRPYPWRWHGPYYRGWGPRPGYGYRHYGYGARPPGPAPYQYRRR